MVLFPYSPMSELVWSQTEGLGIKYTLGSELGKVPLFWSTESFNIVIPSTDNPIKEERMQLHVSSEMASGRKVTGLFSAHRSLSDVLPVSLVRKHARDSRSCGQINLTNQLNPVHAQVRMSTENFEKDEESTNSSVKKSSKVSNEKGPANDGVSISTFQPFCSYQENFKEKVQIANFSNSQFLHENLQYGPKLTIKGKEKVVYKKECAAKESDDRNESVESTGSIMSKRKRPCLLSTNLKNSGKSKRLKAEGKESSFMNWMSTIVNGIESCCQPAPVTPLSVAKQQQPDEKGPSSSSHMSYENHANGKMHMPFKPMGFTSLFHALYQKNITISSYGFTSLDKSSQKEDNYGLNANRTSPSQDEDPSNQNEGRACVLQTTVQLNSTPNNESRLSEAKRNRDTNSGYLENFWITRLLPKEASSSQPPIENDTIDINKEANDRFDDKGDQILKSNFNPILPSSKSKESEAIVSVFARRLGAIKHAKPLNFSNCKNQGDIEERIEGSSSPNKDRRMVLWLGDEDTNANEANEERNIGLMEVGSTSANYWVNGNSAMPNPNFWAQGAIDETQAILEAVRRLRLSRTDVVRRLKSQIQHATLDGFFLRLRLGKLNEAVGRSGYYVARINGLSGEKCLSVAIGNFTCLVECHCISNQDFLEDELKAWFSAALKGDFRLPSKEELDRKLKERDLVV